MLFRFISLFAILLSLSPSSFAAYGKGNIRIAPHGIIVTTPEIAGNEATVCIEVELDSDADEKELFADVFFFHSGDHLPFRSQRESIYPTPGVRRQRFLLEPVAVDHPLLWSPASPALYKVLVRILHADGSLADSSESSFGIREAEFSSEHGLMFNGVKTFLKGVAHPFSSIPPEASSHPDSISRYARIIKDAGFNHIRTCRPSPLLADICDREGIVLVADIFTTWPPSLPDADSLDWLLAIPQYIAPLRNHPSVVMWGLGTAASHPSSFPFDDEGITPYRLARLLIDRYDSSRPATVAIPAGCRDLSSDSIPSPLALMSDVASYDDGRRYIAADRRLYPWMIFYQGNVPEPEMERALLETDTLSTVGIAVYAPDFLTRAH